MKAPEMPDISLTIKVLFVTWCCVFTGKETAICEKNVLVLSVVSVCTVLS